MIDTDINKITLMVFWTTRKEVEETFAKIRTRWTEVAEEMGPDTDFVSGVMDAVLRTMPDWSAPSDLARVPVNECCEIRPLMDAVREVFPAGDPIRETLRNIIDALAAAYPTGDESETEEWQRGPDGLWALVRERGEDVEEEDGEEP